jgi:hypothetical protein
MSSIQATTFDDALKVIRQLDIPSSQMCAIIYYDKLNYRVHSNLHEAVSLMTVTKEDPTMVHMCTKAHAHVLRLTQPLPATSKK